MPSTTYLPSTEAGLISFSANFDAKITLDPVGVGLTAIQAGAYTILHGNFVAAWDLLQDPSTRTQPNTVAKDIAKEALIDGAGGIRELVGIIQEFPGTTDIERADLQLTIRDTTPTTIPVPADPPQVTLVKVSGREVTIRLRDILNPDQRGKPDGVKGATLFSFIGDVASQDLDDFTFQGNTGLTEVDMTFPLSVPEGTKVWITASWFNPRTQNGPAAQPQSVYLQFGGQMTQAA